MKIQTPEQWKQISEAFSEVSELPVEKRRLYLESLPQDIRTEVQSLLKHQGNESDFLEQSPNRNLAEALAIRVAGFSEGDTLADFKLLQKVGEGSFGTVFRARQLSLERDVALKITPNIGNEAQVMAHLDHDGIVSVFSETLDENRQLRFICMQYIPGKNLEEHPSTAFKDEESVLLLGIQLADALSYAHGRGILHLDVKPGNILIGDSGRPFLTDFNVSLSKHREQARSLYGGTKNFMPPEQETWLKKLQGADSSEPENTADLYSLGRVLEDVLKKSGIEPDSVSPSFQWILEKCTAPEKKERIQSADELIALLKACVENLHIQKRLTKKDWYSHLADRHPHATLILSILIPHFIGSVINISYNSMRIVSKLTPDQQAVFQKLLMVANPLIYGTALVLLFRILGPILKQGMTDIKKQRQGTLSAPLKVAVISISGWGISSLIFPFGIHFLSTPLSTEIFGHFFISFFLSAMVATTYSALNSQYFFLRILYPRLWIGCTGIRKTAAGELKSLIPKIRSFYYISGTVPLMGAALMVLVGPESLEGPSYTIYRALLATFIGMGIAGVFYSMNSSRDLSETVSVMTE